MTPINTAKLFYHLCSDAELHFLTAASLLQLKLNIIKSDIKIETSIISTSHLSDLLRRGVSGRVGCCLLGSPGLQSLKEIMSQDFLVTNLWTLELFCWPTPWCWAWWPRFWPRSWPPGLAAARQPPFYCTAPCACTEEKKHKYDYNQSSSFMLAVSSSILIHIYYLY